MLNKYLSKKQLIIIIGLAAVVFLSIFLTIVISASSKRNARYAEYEELMQESIATCEEALITIGASQEYMDFYNEFVENINAQKDSEKKLYLVTSLVNDTANKVSVAHVMKVQAASEGAIPIMGYGALVNELAELQNRLDTDRDSTQNGIVEIDDISELE